MRRYLFGKCCERFCDFLPFQTRIQKKNCILCAVTWDKGNLSFQYSKPASMPSAKRARCVHFFYLQIVDVISPEFVPSDGRSHVHRIPCRSFPATLSTANNCRPIIPAARKRLEKWMVSHFSLFKLSIKFISFIHINYKRPVEMRP